MVYKDGKKKVMHFFQSSGMDVSAKRSELWSVCMG